MQKCKENPQRGELPADSILLLQARVVLVIGIL